MWDEGEEYRKARSHSLAWDETKEVQMRVFSGREM